MRVPHQASTHGAGPALSRTAWVSCALDPATPCTAGLWDDDSLLLEPLVEALSVSCSCPENRELVCCRAEQCGTTYLRNPLICNGNSTSRKVRVSPRKSVKDRLLIRRSLVRAQVGEPRNTKVSRLTPADFFVFWNELVPVMRAVSGTVWKIRRTCPRSSCAISSSPSIAARATLFGEKYAFQTVAR